MIDDLRAATAAIVDTPARVSRAGTLASGETSASERAAYSQDGKIKPVGQIVFSKTVTESSSSSADSAQ
jgi:hypothetical protein